MKTENYKIGDKVKVLEGSSYGHCRTVGQFYTICQINSDGIRLLNINNEEDGNGFLGYEHITKNDVLTFKTYI